MLFPRELLTGRILVRPSRAIIEINTPLEWARKGHDIPVEIRHGCNMISKLDKVAHKTITMSDLPHPTQLVLKISANVLSGIMAAFEKEKKQSKLPCYTMNKLNAIHLVAEGPLTY